MLFPFIYKVNLKIARKIAISVNTGQNMSHYIYFIHAFQAGMNTRQKRFIIYRKIDTLFDIISI